jgi:hypothetical protein
MKDKKSTGPRTPEGKARSRRNATRHGLLARHIVLDNESRRLFRRSVNQLMEQFHATTPAEITVVEEMAVSRWRLERAWAIEANRIQAQMHNCNEDDEVSRISSAFLNLSHGPADLGLLHRYETRLSRLFQAGMRSLCLLRGTKFPNELPPLDPSV